MSKLISPTIKLDDANLRSLQLQQGESSSSAQTSRSVLSQRFLHPVNAGPAKEANYKIHVPNFSEMPPLKLGYKYITNLTEIDSNTPSDLYADEYINKAGSGLDNYYFDPLNGLGEFSRFEKELHLNLPDKFFEEHNSSQTSTKMGMFPEVDRVWIAVDNRLILWNYRAPQSSFNKLTQFLTIDAINNTILTVKIVRPKPGIFVDDVKYLLLVATTMDIHIYILNYDEKFNNMTIFNPGLSVSTHGLIVNQIIENDITHDIYFTGEGDGVNIWRLDYSNKGSFTKNKCDKVCMTKSGISSVLPISRLPLFGSDSTSQNVEAANVPETICQLAIDSSKNILYSLSTRSVIRVYQLQASQEQFTQLSHITPQEMFKSISNMFVDSANFKAFSKFRIVSIVPILAQESANVQLIAVTNYGCRILLPLGNRSAFASYISSFNSGSKIKLSVATLKFPPSKETPKLDNELDAFTKSKQYTAQLIENQQKSELLKNTKFSKILSPGIFLAVKKTKRSDKLFVCTTNYGFLKKNGKLVEDAEYLKYAAGDENNAYLNESTLPTYIHDIVQLTPSMNATNTPNGYANIPASQYTKKPMQFAVLSNYGVTIYRQKTSDQIIKSLREDTIENFIEENGFEETCLTLLYLSCAYGAAAGFQSINSSYKKKAQALFSTCGNNARLLEQASLPQLQPSLGIPQQRLSNEKPQLDHPTVEQVILSDRFYGTCLLVSRLFRNHWNEKVFEPLPHIKINPAGQVDASSIKDDNLLVKNLKLSRSEIEFCIGSVVVIINFFAENGNSIHGLSAPNYSSDPSKFENEVCLRAEHIAFTSILKSLNSIKESLSFLLVLIDETQGDAAKFSDIMKYLSVSNQLNLLSLLLKDLLLPNTEVKNLIKDLLSCVINKNILKGGSIDLIASSLQSSCGSFCSTDDVFIFKAIENLTRAKNVGSRDNDLKNKCLYNAVLLFERAYDSLTFENIENSVNSMLDLEFYTGTVKLLLKLAHNLGNTSHHPRLEVASAMAVTNDNSIKRAENEQKRLRLYDLIFKVLTRIDYDAARCREGGDQLRINEITSVREATYETCFASQDKSFHYEFYQWFINQNLGDRLLDVNSPFILPFLEEKSENNLSLRNLLWLYHAKRENYYAAANILFSLAISEFKLELSQRVEYLSRAIGFCNCVCPPNVRQKMIHLSSVVLELFDVANIQLDLLAAIKADLRISKDNKDLATQALNFKILNISELFNNYTDPLGYYNLSLLIFKVSDYKNSDDILKRWELFFERILHEFLTVKEARVEPLYITITNLFTPIGLQLSSNDTVFPLDDLVKLICKTIRSAIEEDSITQTPPRGALVDMFLKCGVKCDRLYYSFQSLLEYNSFEVYSGFTDYLKKSEMPYLIKRWYQTDKTLKDGISDDKIRNLQEYALETDPVAQFLRETS